MYTHTHTSEEYSLTNAAFQIIRGGIIPMDIASVHVADDTKCYMTLLCNWGLVADVDIESEKWRKIGDTRFTLGEWAYGRHEYYARAGYM